MSDGYILGSLLDEDYIESIDFCCKKCGHSSEDHDNMKSKCEHGMFRKCDCRHFELDFEEIDEAKQELMKIEDLLFEGYDNAKRLHDC